MSKRAVLLLTLPHTGTHFLRSFFQHMPGVREVISASKIYNHGDGVLGDGVTLAWGHFHSDLWSKQKPLALRWRPVVPMRDPLAVMISYHQRGYALRDCEAALTQWVRAARRLHRVGPHYLPLDLLETREERQAAWLDLARAAGFDTCDPAIIDHCERWSEGWTEKLRHSAGPHPLKDAYAAGDLDPIKAALGDIYDRLCSSEPKLRPWLEAMGYRNLLWWSDTQERKQAMNQQANQAQLAQAQARASAHQQEKEIEALHNRIGKLEGSGIRLQVQLDTARENLQRLLGMKADLETTVADLQAEIATLKGAPTPEGESEPANDDKAE